MPQTYYQSPYVRARIQEFLGTTSTGPTAMFITADGPEPHVEYSPRPVTSLEQCLSEGLDIGRSLWDRQALIAHLDIEYVNFDEPGRSWQYPVETFEVQQLVVRAVEELLTGFGITFLHLLSGRGHHFLWSIRKDSEAFGLLAKIGHVPEPLAACYQQPRPPNGEIVEPELGSAYSGLGMLMEYVAQYVVNAVSEVTPIPVELTAVKVPNHAGGHEAISIDISEYADPLYTRGTRVPFSIYLKPLQQRFLLSRDLMNGMPPLFVIPLFEMDVRQGLLAMRDIGAVLDLARRASVRIPDSSDATNHLLDAYAASPLARFHESFYSCEQSEPENWPQSYDAVPLNDFPPCISMILQQPNERLLKPEGIRQVVRVLLANHWHPRDIAGLIRSKYERNFGWGHMWYRYNACSRADFYVRIFAGMIWTGRDGLLDFSCDSTKENGECPVTVCSESLEKLGERLKR
jgi:hypothetical protein